MISACKFALILLLTAAALPASAQYRCVVGGKTMIQNDPCLGMARRSDTMPAPATSKPPPAAGPAPLSDLERQKAYFAAQEKSRRVAAIREEIEALDRQDAMAREQRDNQLAYIEMRKLRANNNLAGATLEQGLATEMQAITSRHAADQAARNERLRLLRSELDALK